MDIRTNYTLNPEINHNCEGCAYIPVAKYGICNACARNNYNGLWYDKYNKEEVTNCEEFLIINPETKRCPVCHFDLESKYRHAFENEYCPCCGFGDNGLLGGKNG